MDEQPTDKKSVENFALFMNTTADLMAANGFDDSGPVLKRVGERFIYDMTLNAPKDIGFHDDAPIRVVIRIQDTQLDEKADPYVVYQLLPSVLKPYSVKAADVNASIADASAFLMTVFLPLVKKLESADYTSYQEEWELYGFYGKAAAERYPFQTNLFVMESLFGRESAERTLSSYYQSLSPDNQATFRDAFFGIIAFPAHPDDKGWHADTIHITYAYLKQARYLDLTLKDVNPPEASTAPPVIELDDEGIIIDGKALLYPITMADLVETIGEPRREQFEDKKDGTLDSYIWDDLGVTALASGHNGDYLGQFTVLIESEGPKSFDYTPHHSKLSFKGSLRIGETDYRQAIFIDIHTPDDFTDIMLGESVFLMARFNKDLTNRHVTRVVVSYLNIPEKKFRFFKKKK